MEKFHSSSVKIAFNDDETSELNYLEIDGNSVNSLVVTGAPRLLFHYATDDDSVNIDMYSDEQVCNVSMARDTSKIISFLETRGLKGVEFTQDEGYFWHEYVFYMDYSGEMLKAIRADGGYVFNATEWLFIPGYQVGTLTAQDGTNKHVVLIDYEQGGYALILNAPEKEIFYPDIWVGEP